MKQWTIYCHTHTDSGRRYTGLTSTTWQRRWSQHVTRARHSKKRWKDPKYGSLVLRTIQEALRTPEVRKKLSKSVIILGRGQQRLIVRKVTHIQKTISSLVQVVDVYAEHV